MAAINNNLNQDIEIKLEMTSTRHCALCYRSLTSNQLIVPCGGGGCRGKRVYCSENCREKDWTPIKPDSLSIHPAQPKAEAYVTAAVLGLIDVDSGTDGDGQGQKKGQGHSSWCHVPCGEEDVDWMVTQIPGKGQGLIALKDTPSKSRILVEGLDLSLIELLIHTGGSHMSHGHMTGSQGYIHPVYESNTGNSLNYLTGLRSHFVNHSCDANAAKIIDQDYFALILYAKRGIQAGEEITVNYTMFNEIYSPLLPIPNLFDPDPQSPPLTEEHRQFLESKWGIICPSSCLCRQPTFNKELTIMRKLWWMLSEEGFGRKGATPQGLLSNEQFVTGFIPYMLHLHGRVKGNYFQKSILLDAAFLVGIQQNKNLHFSVGWNKDAFEIWSSILHPEGRFAVKNEILMKAPTSADKYGFFDNMVGDSCSLTNSTTVEEQDEDGNMENVCTQQ